MAKKACINIHFDSINWFLENESRYLFDPVFSNVDRFFAISEKFGFKFTVFVNGKDLEDPKSREVISEWARRGHEVGNHSYSHRFDFGKLKYNELEMEVMKSHEIITKTCGKEPRGFAAPHWSISDDLVDVLNKNGYLYDTSLFPSYFMWFATIKSWWNFREDPKRGDLLKRSDRVKNLLSKREPYLSNKLLVIPLPVTPIARIPCWHTMAYILPGSLFNMILKSCLRMKYFHYVLHGVDLLDSNDIARGKNIQQLKIPLERKTDILCRSIKTIIERAEEVVTFEEMAKEIIAQI